VSSQQNTGNSSAPGTFHKSYQKSYTIRYGAEGMRIYWKCCLLTMVTFSCICYWFNILGFRCAWVCVSPISAWVHLQPLQMFICFSQLWNVCNSVTGIVLVLIQQNSCFWVSDRSAFYMWGKNIKDNFA